MIWGVGTGRCGTKSLAEDLGGVHEPQPWLGEDAILCHYGDKAARSRTMDKLRERFQSRKPCVDLAHSWLIPEILEVDPGAMFIWVIRRPTQCVHSFLAGGSWTERDFHGTRKWYPRAGWPDDFTRFDKACEYWREVNMLIWEERNACPERFGVIQTERLVNHENKYPERIRYEFSDEEINDLKLLEILHDAMLTPSAKR